jgi:hypothetical protein
MRNCPMSLLRSRSLWGRPELCSMAVLGSVVPPCFGERRRGGLGLFAPIAMIRIAIRNPRQTVACS